MAPRRTWQFSRPPSERRWGSVAVGIGATVATFALALVSMQSLPRFSARDAASDRAIFVPLPAPVPVPTPVTPPRNRTREAPTARVAAPQPADRVTPDVPPVAGPVTPPSQTRDTAATGGNATADPSAPARGASSGIGAPLAPAGINLGNRVPNTAAVRDSIARAQMIGIPDLARTRAPTGREKAELEESQRQALAVRRRSTTAGNSADLVVLQGRGMGGVGAVSGPGMGSVGVPLFASGPSRAQRKKNEALIAEYQGRLRRLDDRVLLKRDSVIVADSIRADSLRRNAAQRDSLTALAGPRRP